MDLQCPRTFKEDDIGKTKKNYIADLGARFGYIRNYVKGWNVNGVILQSVKYCDVHGYEVPGLEDYLDSIGLPNTYLEHDYSEGS